MGERQQLLAVIAFLVFLFVIREILTLNSAEHLEHQLTPRSSSPIEYLETSNFQFVDHLKNISEKFIAENKNPESSLSSWLKVSPALALEEVANSIAHISQPNPTLSPTLTPQNSLKLDIVPRDVSIQQERILRQDTRKVVPQTIPQVHQLELPFAGAYMCHDVSESYGAAWIIHKSKFLQTNFGPPWTEPFNIKDMSQSGWSIENNVTFKSVNMEGASHIVLKQTKGAFKTFDAFDFMVEHLSIYERRLGLLHLPDKVKPTVTSKVIEVMAKRSAALKQDWTLGGEAGRSVGDTGVPPQEGGWGGTRLGDRVVATMPFYGSGVGTGHSVAKTRFIYLNATFFSISKVFQHVVVFVENEADRRYCAELSGLPFFEVVLIKGLTNPKLLGVATVLEMQRKFQSQEWEFDWMYFTESDQVLHLRPHQLKDLLKFASNVKEIIAPHRFLPFPNPQDFEPQFYTKLRSLNGGLKKELETIESKVLIDVENEQSARCCFDGGNCRARPQWVSWKPKKGQQTLSQALEAATNEEEASEGDFRRDVQLNPFYNQSGLKGWKDAIAVGAKAPVHLIRASGSNALINGEGNLFKMSFRTCRLQQAGSCS